MPQKRIASFRVEGRTLRRTARVDVLFVGYTEPGVASTVTLVRDDALHLVLDPGMTPSPLSILKPLAKLGEGPKTITDVVFSHHHPDHTLNAALFPAARFHDHWATYQGDHWTSRAAEGFELGPSVRLLETPGHTLQDITTLVGTPKEIWAFTHLWWDASGPPEDPFAVNPVFLHAGRHRILAFADRIAPGHGPPFAPGPNTPR